MDLNRRLLGQASTHDAMSEFDPLKGMPGRDILRGNRNQQTANTIDPWVFYDGNIAAACFATNDDIMERERGAEDDRKRKQDEISEEKRRQRASSRLTAWQSRERNRIEFEVLQERQTELKSRNEDLKKENDQLQRVIKTLKTNVAVKLPVVASSSGSATSTMPSTSNLLPTLSTSQRMQPSENLMFPYHQSVVSAPRHGDSPFLRMPQIPAPDPGFLFHQHRANTFQGDRFLRHVNGMYGLPTMFTPLIRGPPEQHALQQQQMRLGSIDLSTFVVPPSSQEEKVDVPLFRAIPKKMSCVGSKRKRKGSESPKSSSLTKSTKS